jgi:hypothetical protein
MSLRVSSVSVLSCVGSGVEIGLIPHPRVPPTLPKYQIIFYGNRPESLTRKPEEEEEEE